MHAVATCRSAVRAARGREGAVVCRKWATYVCVFVFLPVGGVDVLYVVFTRALAVVTQLRSRPRLYCCVRFPVGLRPCSLAVLIKSLGCGTLLWRKEMETEDSHGVTLVCDIGDEDMIVTGDTVRAI